MNDMFPNRNKSKMPFGAMAFLLLIVFGGFALLSNEKSKDVDSLSFSNTMEWELEMVETRQEPFVIRDDWEHIINVSPPPLNTSRETREEIATILSYKKLRTEDAIRAITKEIDFDATMGGYPIFSYLDASMFASTAKLLEDGWHDLTILILRKKEKFDRVRPHLLEPGIEPIIDVPHHPAYPSGHATQAYFFAYMLEELRPDIAKQLSNEASHIALHREVAGVHYPSDSEAGRLVARQFVDELLRMPSMAERWKNARNEWR